MIGAALPREARRPDQWIRGWHVAHPDNYDSLVRRGWEPGRQGGGIYGRGSYVALDRETAAIYAEAWGWGWGDYTDNPVFVLAELDVRIPPFAHVSWHTDAKGGWGVAPVPKLDPSAHVTAVLDRAEGEVAFSVSGPGGNQLAVHDTALCRIETRRVRLCHSVKEIFA